MLPERISNTVDADEASEYGLIFPVASSKLSDTSHMPASSIRAGCPPEYVGDGVDDDEADGDGLGLLQEETLCTLKPLQQLQTACHILLHKDALEGSLHTAISAGAVGSSILTTHWCSHKTSRQRYHITSIKWQQTLLWSSWPQAGASWA